MTAIGWSALSSETQLKYLNDADKPFDVDPRSEREVKAYNLGQAKNRGIRNDRKQWERMKAYLGDEAPATFGSFRRIKYRNGRIDAFYDTDENGNQILRTGEAGDSKRWLELEKEYRQARKDYGTVEIAKAPGGRHYGKMLDMQGWSETKLDKSLRSFSKRIEEHEEKIRNPSAHYSDWAQSDEKKQLGELRHWQKEIDNFTEQKAIAEYILKERKRKP